VTNMNTISLPPSSFGNVYTVAASNLSSKYGVGAYYTGATAMSIDSSSLRPKSIQTESLETQDVVVGGTSLKSFMSEVTEKLAILMPNHELERDWDELRDLANKYREVESRIKSQLEVWRELKRGSGET
jgi:hypothetical protein